MGVSIRIRGAVQGVGFRPHVWRLANELGLTGHVLNDAEGVLIHARGNTEQLEQFCQRLVTEKPPLARIDELIRGPLAASDTVTGFTIAESAGGQVRTAIVPDAATCPACLAEIKEPRDRRYRYAFGNCTHCGPRLSIVARIPYDRANTSMSDFDMCSACRAEYENPHDRRFHAQPIACPECGPRLWLEDEAGQEVEAEDALSAASRLLKEGRILAIKGIGGFHLACDALNDGAVAELRRRKRRGDKPFAVMVRDVAATMTYAQVEDEGLRLLKDQAAPIVLMHPSDNSIARRLVDSVAPGQCEIGIMLPYAPLHHLLLEEVDGPLVMTSGNGRDEPQVIDNAEARGNLAGIADAYLMHDRRIARRIDDSVVRVLDGRPRILRRARGFVPTPIRLPDDLPRKTSVLGIGGDLKNTFCLSRDGEALMSQHIGDLSNPLTQKDWLQAQSIFQEMLDFSPDAVAVDLHPDYSATRLGEAIAVEQEVPLIKVQHHHAHVAACMVENGIRAGDPPVLGIALDGLGMGDDGTVWGGEFLSCRYESFTRLGRFTPVALPGGDLANRQPWRNTYAHLRRFLDPDEIRRLSVFVGRSERELAAVEWMLERNVNAPLASSAGRLIDAVAAAVGIAPDEMTFEGEAAQKLEACAMRCPDEAGHYDFTIRQGAVCELDWSETWTGILEDLGKNVDAARIARRFHNTLAVGVREMAATLMASDIFSCVALTGGVFANRLLLENTSRQLERICRVITHECAPSGDGGLSLGQSAIALATIG